MAGIFFFFCRRTLAFDRKLRSRPTVYRSSVPRSVIYATNGTFDTTVCNVRNTRQRVFERFSKRLLRRSLLTYERARKTPRNRRNFYDEINISHRRPVLYFRGRREFRIRRKNSPAVDKRRKRFEKYSTKTRPATRNARR